MSTLERAEAGAAKARLAADLLSFTVGAPAGVILGVHRGPPRAASARQVVMYLLAAAFGMTQLEIAAAVGRDRTTVAHGLKRIEDQREDERFDLWLTRLEVCLRAAPAPLWAAGLREGAQ